MSTSAACAASWDRPAGRSRPLSALATDSLIRKRYNRPAKELERMPGDQNFKNHTRVYPLFHIWTFFPLLVNFLWSLYRLRFGITPDSVVAVILAFGLLAFF